MFQHQGIWFPDGEKHFPAWMTKNGEIVDGKGTYQIKKWRACIPHIKQWRTAVDVGAHVGLWSMHLARRFRNVFAYEPVRAFRECFIKNVDPDDWEQRAIDESWGRGGSACNVELFPYALGRTRGTCSMVIPPLDGGLDTGGTHVGGVQRNPELLQMETVMLTLDEQFLHVDGAVDFIKIDCEGFEHEVIAGAEKLLLAARPCVIVEQKPHKLGPNFGIQGTPAVDLLLALGAEVRAVLSGDYIMSWS